MLYPQCLDMGVSPSLFWDYSIGEIYDLLNSYNRKMKLESEKELLTLKKEISLNAVLARQIGEFTASLFNKDSKVTPLTELFPELFKEELESVEKSNLQIYKANMSNFALCHNEKIKKKGGQK